MINDLRNTLLCFPRKIKQLLAVFCDVCTCAFAVQLAVVIISEKYIFWSLQHTWLFLVGLAFFLPIFTLAGLYNSIFRYAGLQFIFILNQAVSAYFLMYALVFTVLGINPVSRSLGILQPLLFGMGILITRMLVRNWLGGVGRSKLLVSTSRALIYGAGEAGRQLATGLSPSKDICVIGYVDDDYRLHGHNLNGLKIYSPNDLASVVALEKVTQIYLALPSVNSRRRNEIINQLIPLHVKVRTIPGLSDLASGKVVLSDLSELNVEDLLGREPVQPNLFTLESSLSGKVVIVTGAGGSIGSELCRQILKTRPSSLLLVELSEYALYEIHSELEALVQKMANKKSNELLEPIIDYSFIPNLTKLPVLIPLLADVRDANRMEEIFSIWKPSIVYHAAAYKHVPLVEHNPAEGVKNNVMGTLTIARQSLLHGVTDFVLVSTDKAVRPTNVMGASKRLAEMVLQAKAATQESKFGVQGVKTRFSIVRFGNVLGSSGSVVPLFRKQIANGGPITLTDDRMTRYFMTIPEAVQLVIHASTMAAGGEVFVLDMGLPVKILDLATKMVELSGLMIRDSNNPKGDIEIKLTGLRPGEKLYEELLIGDNPLPTSHPRILKAHEEFLPWDELEIKLNILRTAISSNNVPIIRTLLKELVSGYQPPSSLVDWVWMENEKSSCNNSEKLEN